MYMSISEYINITNNTVKVKIVQKAMDTSGQEGEMIKNKGGGR